MPSRSTAPWATARGAERAPPRRRRPRTPNRRSHPPDRRRRPVPWVDALGARAVGAADQGADVLDGGEGEDHRQEEPDEGGRGGVEERPPDGGHGGGEAGEEIETRVHPDGQKIVPAGQPAVPLDPAPGVPVPEHRRGAPVQEHAGDRADQDESEPGDEAAGEEGAEAVEERLEE